MGKKLECGKIIGRVLKRQSERYLDELRFGPSQSTSQDILRRHQERWKYFELPVHKNEEENITFSSCEKI